MNDPAVQAPASVRGSQRGSVLPTVLALMIPLLMLVTAGTTMMTGRNSLLLGSVQQGKARLAAVAAIEDAAQAAQEGTLVSGVLVSRILTNGVRYEYTATYLASDGEDNDGDGLFNEADERAFEVVSEGRHGLAKKRMSALVIEPAPPPPFEGVILATGTPEIRTTGSSVVTGRDTRINGAPGNPLFDVAGIATEPPHSLTDLTTNYTHAGSSVVTGRGGATPNFGVMPATYNLPGIISVARYAPDNVLAPGTHTGSGLGEPTLGLSETTYCAGDLRLASNGHGAGVLVVAGNLTVGGGFRFDGLVIVLGNVTIEGNALINGALIQGPAAASIDIKGNSTVRFSKEALLLAGGLIEQIFYIEGWRERGAGG